MLPALCRRPRYGNWIVLRYRQVGGPKRPADIADFADEMNLDSDRGGD